MRSVGAELGKENDKLSLIMPLLISYSLKLAPGTQVGTAATLSERYRSKLSFLPSWKRRSLPVVLLHA
ncbi:unnamed protein product [Amaranthus hypochondriacus]